MWRRLLSFIPNLFYICQKKKDTRRSEIALACCLQAFKIFFFCTPNIHTPVIRNRFLQGCMLTWDRAEASQPEGNRKSCVSVLLKHGTSSTSGRYNGSSESLNSQKLHRVKHASVICCYCNIDCLLLLNIIIVVMCTLQDFG